MLEKIKNLEEINVEMTDHAKLNKSLELLNYMLTAYVAGESLKSLHGKIGGYIQVLAVSDKADKDLQIVYTLLGTVRRYSDMPVDKTNKKEMKIYNSDISAAKRLKDIINILILETPDYKCENINYTVPSFGGILTTYNVTKSRSNLSDVIFSEEIIMHTTDAIPEPDEDGIIDLVVPAIPADEIQDFLDGDGDTTGMPMVKLQLVNIDSLYINKFENADSYALFLDKVSDDDTTLDDIILEEALPVIETIVDENDVTNIVRFVALAYTENK